MKEFDKVIGYSSVKKELEMVADVLKNPQKYDNLGVKMPRGILLVGKPGVGKTLLANCFIEACGLKVFVCRKTKADGDFVNEITTTFEKAKENAPAIVFLDDMDKFANGDDLHKNAEEYVSIQSCIDTVKEQKVLVLATCNELRNLPESLLRAGRFDKQIKVSNPVGDDAVAIVDHYLKQKENVSKVDAKEIAKILDGRSCAELETVINEAGIYAGFNNKSSIEMDDIVKACLRVIFKAPEKLGINSEKHIEKIAYHEAGHAVVAEMFEPECVSIVSVCAHEGDICGITSIYHDEEYWIDKELMEKRVVSILAGKAATEIVYGCADTGVDDDVHRAVYIVERFVDDYCSYGFDKFEFARNSSNDLLRRKEDFVFYELEKYYQKAKKILVENRKFLDKLAQELVKKQTLCCQEIQKIKSQCGN